MMETRDLIVIGASAGGIEALEKFFENLPLLNVSIFIVVHLEEERKSFLTEVLSKKTLFKVLTAKNNMPITKRHVYVAPPNYHLMIEKNRITLSKGPRINYSRPAIDMLFTSAAYSYQSRIIGILLSGLLDDGTSGLQDIKSQNGICIVQDPKEAKFKEMPSNALENATIDYCLSIHDIAKKLISLTKSPISKIKKEPTLKKILATEVAPQQIVQTNEDILNKVGKISAFTCPECHGSLWEIAHKNTLRYRCRIGHAYSIKSLSKSQDVSLENTLWAGVRALEENASLSYKIAKALKKNKHAHGSDFYINKGKKADEQAIALRKVLLLNAPKKNNLIRSTSK